MSANVIACISIAGAGLLLIIISIPFFLHEKSLKKKCSAQTIGHVIKYKQCGGGLMVLAGIAYFIFK